MSSRAQLQCEVLVIGGGPAGLAAATRAAESGVRVAIVDDNFSLGGQIWRAGADGDNTEASPWLERLRRSNVAVLSGVRVFQQVEIGVLLAEGMNSIHELHYNKLVIATGARERFLPFPGWTLPNVFGAGGLQALVKSGLPIRGKRIVVAGSGPLLLAVAAYLRRHGGQILMICEQASASTLARFAGSLLRQPDKLAQAIRLKRDLAGIPFSSASWPVAAGGGPTLKTVTISRQRKAYNFGVRLSGLRFSPGSECRACRRAWLQARGRIRRRGRTATNICSRSVLCRRTDRDWRHRVVGRWGRNRGPGCCGTDAHSPLPTAKKGEDSQVRKRTRKGLPLAVGTEKPRNAGNHRLPM